jgi:hypothetical protein
MDDFKGVKAKIAAATSMMVNQKSKHHLSSGIDSQLKQTNLSNKSGLLSTASNSMSISQPSVMSITKQQPKSYKARK